MPRTPVATKIAQGTKIVRGIKAMFARASGTSWLVGGKRYSKAQLSAVYTAHLEAIAEVSAARTTLAAAIERERVAEKRVKAVTEPLKLVVANRFGREALLRFGWPIPKKKGPTTAAGKAGGVRKRAERRAQR